MAEFKKNTQQHPGRFIGVLKEADADTTYTAGDGLDLSGTTFSTDIKTNSGITIDSTELSMDLGASSITGTLAVGDGGTGLTTVATDSILTGNGAGALTAESELKFFSSVLAIGSATDSSVDKIARTGGSTDIDGGDLSIYGGDTRPSASTNRAGGSINLYGGLSTGNAASGGINIFTGWEGVSGTGQLGPGKHSSFLSTATYNALTIYEPNSAANDYLQIKVEASGATTITTVDAAAHAADLTFNVDGDAEIAADVITLDSAGDIELETGAVTNYVNTDGLYRGGNIGDIQYVSSVYYVPITATDFQGHADSRGADAWGMEGTNGGEWASHGRAPGFIEKVIPLGFTAVGCIIYGDTGTNTFEPFESALNASTVTSRGSATAIGSTCTFSSNVVGDGTKTVSIKLIVGEARDFFFGGKLILIKT
mgnify:CR=1 FL=1